jgi:multidrug efflux system membrane fusion protein
MNEPSLPPQPQRSARRRSWVWTSAVAIAVTVGAVAFSITHFEQVSAASKPPAAPPLPAVTVSAALAGRAVNWTSFSGQFSAINNVEIRAQVSGYLTEIHFTDGQIVHKGDLLFVIDPRPFQIQLEQANAAVLTAQAQLAFATKEVRRLSSLQNSGAATVEQLDQRMQQQVAAQAALQQAQADVQSAQLNLEFCHITAPFTGRISRRRVSIGSLVSGGANASNSTLLTTLVSLDPIYLDFQMSEDDYLTYERYVHAMHQGSAIDNSVQAGLSDEQGFPRRGTLEFVDNQINPGSGTIHARAVFSNQDLFIAPGEFAQLRLPTSSAQPVLLLPDAALEADQSNQVVMTVAADGTVVPKIVQTGGMIDGLREIQGGLGPHDKVVINGLMHAWPGMKVAPQPGTISATAKTE